MAHTYEGKGPYPDKAGEFCGNHLPGAQAYPSPHESPEQAEEHNRRWLAQMQFGKPSNCKAGTSAEMASRGFVGLYLKEDAKLWDWETAIPSDGPLEELTEDYVTRDALAEPTP